MFEEQTFEHILSRMLKRVPAQMDKREGSILYDALAPAAAELAQSYVDLDLLTRITFADTATGEFLERRTAEYGIRRKPATKAVRKGIFKGKDGKPLDVPLGSRFSLDNRNFTVMEKIGEGEFSLEHELPGVAGNEGYGNLLPVDYIEGLTQALLSEVLVPGEDAEEDEALRERYLTAINEQPFGGNVSDYRRKIGTLPGIGGVKIFPVWQGGGTVKCTLIAADYTEPSEQLLEEVQTLIDPEANRGQGMGFAPIGHRVTIAGVKGVPIDVTTRITLEPGLTLGQVLPNLGQVLQDYLQLLRKSWADEQKLIVRVSQIEARILGIKGVADITGTELNGSASNIELGAEEIPTAGEVKVFE